MMTGQPAMPARLKTNSLCPETGKCRWVTRSRSTQRLRLSCQAALRGSKNGQAQGKKHGQGQGSSQGRARQPSPGSGGPERRRTARLSEEALEVCREALDSGKGVTAETVLRTLRGTDFPPNTSRKSVMPEGQTSIDAFCLGLVGSRWPQVSEDTHEASELCRLLCAFLRGPNGPAGGADFPFTSIQLNSRYASKRHVDANNAGHSMIIGLGEYEGGLLDVDGVGLLDVNGSWHRFDGNVPHCTTPVTGGGERYSIIYFTNSSLVHANPGALLELQQLGFNLDSLERAGGLETQEDVIGRIRAADTGEERCLVVENLTNAVLGEDLALPALEWHREVRLFIRESTSSAQVAWAGLCHDGDGRPSDTGFVIVRDESVAEPVARALRKASKGRLKVGRFAEWRQAAPSGVF